MTLEHLVRWCSHYINPNWSPHWVRGCRHVFFLPQSIRFTGGFPMGKPSRDCQERHDFLGLSISFHTSRGDVLVLQGAEARKRRTFLAPSGSQIVGLQFQGEKQSEHTNENTLIKKKWPPIEKGLFWCSLRKSWTCGDVMSWHAGDCEWLLLFDCDCLSRVSATCHLGVRQGIVWSGST